MNLSVSFFNEKQPQLAKNLYHNPSDFNEETFLNHSNISTDVMIVRKTCY